MNVIINVGLWAGEDKDIHRRAGEAIAYIKARALSGSFALSTMQLEPCLIFSGAVRDSFSFHGLADETQQDCVAVWHSDTGVGCLYGPRTQPYEPFNVTLFQTPLALYGREQLSIH